MPYEPSRTKRFEISADAISRERLKTLHGAYQDWKQKLPEVGIGFTLYGSLSKGKVLDAESAKHSDVDVRLFIDQQDIERSLATLPEEIMQHYYDIATAEAKVQMNPETAWRAVADLMRRDITQRFAELATPTDCSVSAQPIAMHGDHSIAQHMEHYLYPAIDQDPSDPSNFADGYTIASYWHLDVGGGMRPYRKAFLEELKRHETPEEQERIWSTIHDAIISVERAANIPEQIAKQFPATFADACQYYGVTPSL